MGMRRFYVGAMLLGIPNRSQNRSAQAGRTRTSQKAALIEPFSVSSEKRHSPGNLPVNPGLSIGFPIFQHQNP
jgi:hypothetical protein